MPTTFFFTDDQIKQKRENLLAQVEKIINEDSKAQYSSSYLMDSQLENYFPVQLENWYKRIDTFYQLRNQQLKKARSRNIFESNISIRTRLRRLPIIGYLLASTRTLLGLPLMRMRIDELEIELQHTKTKLDIYEQEHKNALERDQMLVEQINFLLAKVQKLESISLEKPFIKIEDVRLDSP